MTEFAPPPFLPRFAAEEGGDKHRIPGRDPADRDPASCKRMGTLLYSSQATAGELIRMEQRMKEPGSARHENRASRVDFDWILEAIAPLRFPLAQGLWLLRPWLGSERVARWVADLEGTPRVRDHKEGSP